MKTIKRNIKALVLITGLVLSFTATANTTVTTHPQITFDDDVEDVEDVPPLPIDGLLGLGLAAGAYLGLRKRFKNAN
jgi:hypothetical protein